MQDKLSVDEYFRFPESNRPMELIYGYVHEPAMPFGEHQLVVAHVTALLDAHVRMHSLGNVFAPLDVVLDRDAALVVQPDVLFISNARLDIVPDRVWGAPDLVVEVASPSTQHRDRTLKTAWYKRYGVRECWLIYPQREEVEVVNFEEDTRKTVTGDDLIESRVLPEFHVRAKECFRNN